MKGQPDHIDAWLMSYADLITLLFMLFVIVVSVSVVKHESASVSSNGDQAYGKLEDRSGMLALGTPYDEIYSNIMGVVVSTQSDQNIAVEKSAHALSLDIASALLFEGNSTELSKDQLPIVHSIAKILKESAPADYLIEVQGHTSNITPQNNTDMDNWDLSALRASHVVKVFIEQGISPEHLRAVSYSGMHPLVPNLDSGGNIIERNSLRNQRVVIRLSANDR
jgi:chemotaxis protein MotB